jgi:2-oxo-4-hydroxy-4-carboxy--5-ureidoimidazoline (OHCU) decarboxylase
MAARADLAAIFERAPALVDRVSGDTPEAIVSSARRALSRMGERERMAVLDAHPRIGGDPAALSELSRREQGADADPAVLRELSRLNVEYERRFGFRFVVFVHGRTKRDVLEVLRERIGRTREQELATGLEEFLAITRDRLEKART